MRYLIIDSLSALYLRNYTINPTLDSNGNPIGGIVGSFRSLQKICNKTKPDRVIVVWDGPGGSERRKILNKDYKRGRTPIRLNRFDRDQMSPQQELENRIWQQTKLIECFNCLPIIQFMFAGVEADDVIAQICIIPELRGDEKVIVSSDKDFIQLCQEDVILYRPVQDEVLSSRTVLEKYGIHPNNFCLARSIVGDSSDNLMGVRGAGLKVLAKRFPFLAEPAAVSLMDVFSFCSKSDKKLKLFKKILDSEKLILENYKIMQLASPLLSLNVTRQIKTVISEVEFEFLKTKLEFIKMQGGWSHINFQPLYGHMNRIMDNQGNKKTIK